MKPIMPSSASSSGAVDSAHQNAACELSPNSESPQALLSVRSAILRQRCRTFGGGSGIGPVPCRCQGIVYESAGDVAGRCSTVVSSALVSIVAVGSRVAGVDRRRGARRSLPVCRTPGAGSVCGAAGRARGGAARHCDRRRRRRVRGVSAAGAGRRRTARIPLSAAAGWDRQGGGGALVTLRACLDRRGARYRDTIRNNRRSAMPGSSTVRPAAGRPVVRRGSEQTSASAAPTVGSRPALEPPGHPTVARSRDRLPASGVFPRPASQVTWEPMGWMCVRWAWMSRGCGPGSGRRWRPTTTAGPRRDFLLTATPGAGKTTFALAVARRLLPGG